MRGVHRWVLLATWSLATACATWRDVPLQLGVAPTVDAKHPVRVGLANGRELTLSKPSVEGDSLVGYVGSTPLRTTVAWREVRYLEVLSFSRRGTAAGVGGGIAAGALVGAIVLGTMMVALLGVLIGGGI